MAIRNIVFDIGNVVVPWEPHDIVREAFGSERAERPDFRSPLAGNPVWLAVNRGEHTLAEAKQLYVAEQGFEPEEIDRTYEILFERMRPMDDSVALMRELAAADYRLFAITDNVREVVAHIAANHDFWAMFEHASVSAELGVLKPDPRMYCHLLETASLEPGECVFFDDVAANVEGAQAVGMVAHVFTDAQGARADLQVLDVRF